MNDAAESLLAGVLRAAPSAAAPEVLFNTPNFSALVSSRGYTEEQTEQLKEAYRSAYQKHQAGE